jgi:hypothetical protein
MARRKATERSGYGKLLDMWTAPVEAGDPIGCVATSFTFSPAFFEEECLSRFLQIESDPTEDGPVYLIEREEKLAQLTCAAALVDQHHCVGERSLRWDLISARLPRGLLHAKVSLLCWSDLVRVIVTSANLTEDGYRRNLETFGVLDFAPGSGAPRNLLRDSTRFLRLAATSATPLSVAESPALARWLGLLDRVDADLETFGVTEDEAARAPVKTDLVFSGGGYAPVLERLAEIWRGSSPPKFAYVLSPFFDPPGSPNRPARTLWEQMRKRGEAIVAYYVMAEDVPGDESLVLHAPESIKLAEPPGRTGVETQLWRLDLEENRPFHAKILELADDRWVVHLMGSSNFTSAGLGLSFNPNLEANIVYTVDAQRDPKSNRLLAAAFPPGARIQDGTRLTWMPRANDEEDSAADAVLLPSFFGEAVYEWADRQETRLTLTFGDGAPRGWRVYAQEATGVLYDEEQWIATDCPRQFSLRWDPPRPPSSLSVTWQGSDGSAWWPVNVRGSGDLPPPEQLRELPLDVLISILTSARPLYRVLGEFLRRRDRTHVSAEVVAIDPHKRVDTSQFLLQRTRRVSEALVTLRKRLERPAPTVECLAWRLNGPVGVLALAKAVVREAKSNGERGFLISELVLELSRVKPAEAPGCLTSQEVRQEIAKVIGDLHGLLPGDTTGTPENLERYIASVFKGLKV